MKAAALYARLEQDFVKPAHWDDWNKRLAPISAYVAPNFMSRSIGLLLDNAETITKVYTAVFPSPNVISRILSAKEKATDALLFLHHPMGWDTTRTDGVFFPIDVPSLEELKKHRISAYCLHAPLDDFGEYSTGSALAKALHIEVSEPFAPYHGGMSGVLGKPTAKSVSELRSQFAAVMGHEVALYPYSGGEEIRGGKVAIIPGGGNDLDSVKDVVAAGVNVLITGVTRVSAYSKPAHELDKASGITLLGGTHYSTEKFACMEMCRYFKEKVGLPAEFLEDVPDLNDL